MKRITRGIVLSLVAGAAVYLVFGAYANFREVRASLGYFHWIAFAGAILLALCNYLIRFVKWHFYLRRLGLAVAPGRSLAVFLSGFSLTVTPGKLGEVVKAYLLRESDGIPMARTAPIVVAERLTDLLALVLLATTGVLTYRVGARGVLVGAALVALFLVVVSSERLMGALARRAGRKATELYDSMKILIRPRALAITTALSVLAWGCECLAFWVVIHGFPATQASVGLATFIYAVATVTGALSPGGLGVTEAVSTALLIELGAGFGKATAFAPTILVRVATLWFGVAVGVAALVGFQRRTHVTVDLAAARPPA
jgi:uncharacterized membrane protein YbhN (UPF0104 family)